MSHIYFLFASKSIDRSVSIEIKLFHSVIKDRVTMPESLDTDLVELLLLVYMREIIIIILKSRATKGDLKEERG